MPFTPDRVRAAGEFHRCEVEARTDMSIDRYRLRFPFPSTYEVSVVVTHDNREVASVAVFRDGEQLRWLNDDEGLAIEGCSPARFHMLLRKISAGGITVEYTPPAPETETRADDGWDEG